MSDDNRTNLTVNGQALVSVRLGPQPGHHGWRLSVTLDNGCTQVVSFDDLQRANEAYTDLMLAIHNPVEVTS